jgi:hypothetical protein
LTFLVYKNTIKNNEITLIKFKLNKYYWAGVISANIYLEAIFINIILTTSVNGLLLIHSVFGTNNYIF